jgi:hypothetical protein
MTLSAAEACTLLEHLDREAAALRETIDALRQMHQALRGSDLEALRRAEARQEEVAARLERLRRDRHDLVGSLAEAADCAPDELTLRGLAAELSSPLRERLDESRRALSSLASQVAALNHANAALALHGLAFVRGFLNGLLGEAPGGRYSRNGLEPEPRSGAILEAHG